MNKNVVTGTVSSRTPTTPRRPRFYLILAIVYAITVFVGFSRTFYLKALFGAPRLSWLFHLHGLIFTAWTLFFVYQTALVFADRTRDHRRIGTAGALFAACIAFFGVFVTISAIRLGYPTRSTQMPELLISGLMDSTLFGVFFSIGYAKRDRPEIHKRMMMFAMLCAIIPAIARLPIPPAMIGWTILAFSLAGLIYDAVTNRRVYLASVVCVLAINIWSPLHFVLAETKAWQTFTAWVAH